MKSDYGRESALLERITDRAWGRRLMRRRTKRPGAYRPTMIKFPIPYSALAVLLRKKRGPRRR